MFPLSAITIILKYIDHIWKVERFWSNFQNFYNLLKTTNELLRKILYLALGNESFPAVREAFNMWHLRHALPSNGCIAYSRDELLHFYGNCVKNTHDRAARVKRTTCRMRAQIKWSAVDGNIAMQVSYVSLCGWHCNVMRVGKCHSAEGWRNAKVQQTYARMRFGNPP